MLLDLDSGATCAIGRGLLEGEYGGIRYFAHPRLSPDAAYVFSCAQGHEAMIESFEVRSVATSALLFHENGVGDAQSGWDSASRRVAFAGLIGTPADTDPTGVWVYHTSTGRLVRSRLPVILITLVTNIAWIVEGDLAFATYDPSRDMPHGSVFVAPRGDSKAALRLVGGLLPVWVK